MDDTVFQSTLHMFFSLQARERANPLIRRNTDKMGNIDTALTSISWDLPFADATPRRKLLCNGCVVDDNCERANAWPWESSQVVVRDLDRVDEMCCHG